MGKAQGLLAATAAVAVASAPVSGAFIIEEAPVSGVGGWTQQITAPGGAGGIDYIAFELVSDGGGGPFQGPFLTNFVDPGNGDAAVAGWSVISGSGPNLVAATGPGVAVGDSIAFTLYFDGDVDSPVAFEGVAFLDGVFQYSAMFVWNVTSAEFEIGTMSWESGQPPLAVPLPAPIWLGSIGLVALLFLRRRAVS